MIYVIDTNVIIHYLRERTEVVKNLRKSISEGIELLIPRAVDYEIRRGLELLSATKKATVYKALLDPNGKCHIVDMGEDIWDKARENYVKLKRKGFTVGEIDILIGSFCQLHHYPLITDNTKDFVNMDGIKLITWTEAL
ncbi:MAG: PIN domain-containing protein [Defluviitaleaceae bacterium]|nr:PIN domain-containing protein [Defluviitaleaceae bacterium]